MKQFFSTLPRNIIGCFRGRYLLWHMAAIALTFISVVTGFDWFYYSSTRSPVLRSWMFPSAPIGLFVPFLFPCTLLLTGAICELPSVTLAGWAVAQAEIMGSLISSTYKAFTGRAHPFWGGGEDMTHIFRFGFLRGGVFWGWPSSHTTIAFAASVMIFRLLPQQRWIGYAAMAYACYIGLGVSMTIHWFSDFLAGAIIGTVIGSVVSKAFSHSPPPTLAGGGTPNTVK